MKWLLLVVGVVVGCGSSAPVTCVDLSTSVEQRPGTCTIPLAGLPILDECPFVQWATCAGCINAGSANAGCILVNNNASAEFDAIQTYEGKDGLAVATSTGTNDAPVTCAFVACQ